MERLNKILRIPFKINVITGLRIGGLVDSVKIGGVDNPVIKVKKFDSKEGKIKEMPYIPGSSIKGKMRFLLEISGEDEELINKIFGVGINEKASNSSNKISRAIFRDVYPSKEMEGIDIIEIKPENKIELKNGKLQATPRFLERIIPNTKFDGEVLLLVFENDKEDEMIKVIEKGFELINKNYLGGSGTRGYGKVHIEVIKDEIKNILEGE